MGRKAKLKKIRQQKLTNNQSQSASPYDSTKFVEQFKHLGYQVQIDPKLQPKTNRGNISPEIPEDRIEPQL